jgi:hypothetical protein
MASNPSSQGNNGQKPCKHRTVSATAASTEEYKVGPGRPPNEYQYKPGQSGNPKGCACRKPKSGRIRDAARQPRRATRCVRSAEPGDRPDHPGPMTGAFSQYCNSEHTLAGSGADAPRPARRCGPRTRDGSFQSTARQTNSATASPLQWVCRGCPWLVIGA